MKRRDPVAERARWYAARRRAASEQAARAERRARRLRLLREVATAVLASCVAVAIAAIVTVSLALTLLRPLTPQHTGTPALLALHHPAGAPLAEGRRRP